MSSTKYGQELLYLGTVRNYSEVVYLCLSLDVCKQNSDVRGYPPRTHTKNAGPVAWWIRSGCSVNLDLTPQWTPAELRGHQRQSCMEQGFFSDWGRTYDFNHRILMFPVDWKYTSTPVWSKNRVYYIKSHHRKFHKSPQKRSQPALHKGIEMWI